MWIRILIPILTQEQMLTPAARPNPVQIWNGSAAKGKTPAETKLQIVHNAAAARGAMTFIHARLATPPSIAATTNVLFAWENIRFAQKAPAFATTIPAMPGLDAWKAFVPHALMTMHVQTAKRAL
jgi:hypothetical protein